MYLLLTPIFFQTIHKVLIMNSKSYIKLLPLSLASIFSLLLTTNIASAEKTSDAAAIEIINQDFETAMNTGNASGLAAIYTSEGQLLPPNSSIISGKDNIHTFWQGAIDQGIASAELDTIELEVLGDTANEIGHFILKAANGDVIDTGKYIVIWKKQNGNWKYHRDMWSSSNPAK